MDIKPYEKVTLIESFDGSLIKTKAPMEEIKKNMNEKKFISIGWEVRNTASIKKMKETQIDELESFILSQDEEMQNKLREKQARLRKEMWKKMTIKYAKNFVNSFPNK